MNFVPELPPLTEAQKTQVVIGAMLAMFLAALDQTILAPALPLIGDALGNADFLPWVITSYLITATAVTPLYGKWSDIRGRRPAVFLAMALFAAGSIACASSTNMWALIASRALQGAGGGGLLGLAQTIIADVAAPRERAKYVVYISSMWTVASVAGPILGGFLAQKLSWPLIFWINLPIGAVAAVICNRALDDRRQVRRAHRLDGVGALLLVCASGAGMLALTLGGSRMPWTSATVLELAAATFLLSALTLKRFADSAEPLIPLTLFKDRVVSYGSVAISLAMAPYVGILVFAPLQFETMLGLDPVGAGAALVPMLIGTVGGATLSGRMLPRMKRYKRPAIFGVSIAAVACAVYAMIADRIGLASAEALTAIIGFGVGTMFPTVNVAIQNTVDPRDMGVATGTISFLRTFASAASVAALGAVLIGAGFVAAGGGALDPAHAGVAFRDLFLVQCALLLVALYCLLRMPTRPLRGPAATPTPVPIE